MNVLLLHLAILWLVPPLTMMGVMVYEAIYPAGGRLWIDRLAEVTFLGLLLVPVLGWVIYVAFLLPAIWQMVRDRM